ncbi:MAG: hypothetical protein ABI629_02955 [bacterium]
MVSASRSFGNCLPRASVRGGDWRWRHMSVRTYAFRRVAIGSGLWIALAAACLTLVGSPAGAQVQESEFRGADGTTYQVLVASNLGGGAEQIQITTVAGAIAGAGSCAATGDMSGSPTSAIGGVLPPLMQLHPYTSIHRTAILVPNDIGEINFNSSFGGRVTLGTGGGALNVCLNAFDCTGQPNVQALTTLDQNSGGVPAACIAEELNAQCDGLNNRDVFAFGLAASGNPPVCTTPLDTTVNTTVCAPRPADGFTLAEGAAVIFVYNSSLASSGFAVATGGFGITTDAINNAGCAADTVVSATGDNDSQPAPPPPTQTPTNTATNTATFTLTPTNTATQTNTPTLTNTATPTLTNTPTFTQTNTATPTNTRTNTPTPTNTPPPTNTRPPIPVVPSPTSPAGLVMIIGLGGGLLWGLRRMAKVK